MQIRMSFQYKAPDSTPDAYTITDEMTEIASSACIPACGDLVMLQVCQPENERGQFKSFKVVSRNYEYTFANPAAANGQLISCDVIVIVSRASTEDNRFLADH